jgi:hypothetical protein
MTSEKSKMKICRGKSLIDVGGSAPVPPEFTHFTYKVKLKKVGDDSIAASLLHRACATAQGRSPALPLSCTQATLLYCNPCLIGILKMQNVLDIGYTAL